MNCVVSDRDRKAQPADHRREPGRPGMHHQDARGVHRPVGPGAVLPELSLAPAPEEGCRRSVDVRSSLPAAIGMDLPPRGTGRGGDAHKGPGDGVSIGPLW
jgi:hypothetical protein